MSTTIKNPILTGFNPDPCFLRVDDTYYIATSTFEYYPGVQISASKDLVNWKVVARPITIDKEDLRGVPQGGGVWAPCLSYDGKKFYLVYSRISNWSDDPYKDVENYVITADKIEGKWSKPTYLNSDGFDASLFHDDDGKKYYMSVRWDYRKRGSENFSGILLWEFDAKRKALISKPQVIFKGTDRGLVEAPHIYKHDGYYYLFTAEGGTNVEHAQTVARSKNIYGPYELHPFKHFITSYETDKYLQKAGHGSMICDKDGNWYYTHLCGRKLCKGNCVLGRETAIQNMEWKDGWPFLSNGTNNPSDTFTIPYDIEREKEKELIEFNKYTLTNVFQSVRTPMDGKYKVVSPTEIEMVGGTSPRCRNDQSIFVVRQKDFVFHSEVELEFNPETFAHIAGLIYRYNEDNLYLIAMSYDEEKKKNCITLQRYMQGNIVFDERIDYIDGNKVIFTVDADYEKAKMGYKYNGKEIIFADDIDTSYLSDESACPMGFTGAFVGMYVGDFALHSKKATFRNFIYIGKDEK